MRPTTEKEYADALFQYLGRADTQRVYTDPVIDKLVKKSQKGSVAYETAFNSIKRAVVQMAARWKLEHYMSFPLSKAGRDRVHEAIARSIMEIYFIRRKQAAGTEIPQRP